RPKRKKNRHVRIHKPLATLLERYLVEHPKQDDDFLFTTPSGSPIDETNFYERHWKPMLERLGIRERPFYNTRHTYITFLLSRGVGPLWVARQTGTSLKMIEEHYGGSTMTDEELDRRVGANRNLTGTHRPRAADGRGAGRKKSEGLREPRQKSGRPGSNR